MKNRGKGVEHQLSVSETVLMRQKKENKLLKNFNPNKMVITEEKGSSVEATKSNGTKVFQDVSLFKPIESDSDNGDDMETVRPVPPTHEGEEIEENNEAAGLEINPAVV